MKAGREAEQETAGGTSWGFVVNLGLIVVVLTLLFSAVSVMDLRASPAASADPMGDPAVPLTIDGVSVVQLAVGGPGVHVAATQTSFVASFEPETSWHVSPAQCLADVMGVIDPWGDQQWLGQRTGHVETIAGDPSAEGIYATGLGQYCEPGHYSSTDGGNTWTSGTMPGGPAVSPSWLAFDPAHPGTLLAFEAGVLYLGSNSGAAWTSSRSNVTPIGFDSTGRLVGWSPGNLLESADEGSTWRRTGPGPTEAPGVGAATSNGALLSTKAGLWWYPLSAAPTQIGTGPTFSMSALTDGIVVLGADVAGHPRLATVADGVPGMSPATLPPALASLTITAGQVAANDSGAAIALSGATSAIAFAKFVR
jgi:hypothetical protein